MSSEYSIEDDKFYVFGQQVTEERFKEIVESNGGWYDSNRKLAGVSVKSRSNITTGNIPGEGQNPEVDHPAHYNQHPSGVECIDIVRWMGFNLGNVVKYLWRDGLKETEVELQDLEKAAWYLNNEILKRKGPSYADSIIYGVEQQ